MPAIPEYEILQNPALGAVLIRGFVDEFCAARDGLQGPLFASTFIVLPLAYHQVTRELLGHSKLHLHSALQKAVTREPEAFSSLSVRVQGLAIRTLRSLNVGFATGVLTYHPEVGQVWAGAQKIPRKDFPDKVKIMYNVARRAGRSTGSLGEAQALALLGVRI